MDWCEDDPWMDRQLLKRFGREGVREIEREAHQVYHARREMESL